MTANRKRSSLEQRSRKKRADTIQQGLLTRQFKVKAVGVCLFEINNRGSLQKPHLTKVQSKNANSDICNVELCERPPAQDRFIVVISSCAVAAAGPNGADIEGLRPWNNHHWTEGTCVLVLYVAFETQEEQLHSMDSLDNDQRTLNRCPAPLTQISLIGRVNQRQSVYRKLVSHELELQHCQMDNR